MEKVVTEAILTRSIQHLRECIENDVIIVGAGPSGLVAAYYLAKKGIKTTVLERKLSFGGGMGGGGMLFPYMVVEEPADEILRAMGCKLEKFAEKVYTVNVSETIAKLAAATIDAGARILLGVSVEDLIYRENPLRITGVVIQWSAVQLAKLHVDPLMLSSKVVVDATGHDAELVTLLQKKLPETKIEVKGGKSLWVEKGEELVVKKSGKVCEGLYITGIATCTLYSLPRMGPIFGGMLLSGKKVAEEILKEVKKC